MPDVAVAVSKVGSVIATVCVPVQPAESVTVQVYVPASNELAVTPVPPVGVHAYVYGPTPPETSIVASPVLFPLQRMFVCDVNASVGAGVSFTTTVNVAEHPFASVSVQV
jgi:hypothetical protein